MTMPRRLARIRPSQRRRLAGDRGTATVELLTVGAPTFLILLAFAVLVIRGVSASIDVDAAAASAARAASLQRTPPAAVTAARRAAADNLAAASTACRDVRVDVDASRFAPGGAVTVTVTCTVTMTPFQVAGWAPARQVTGHSTSPIDIYRGAA
jgi:Flp pilus assembly protein TadG